MFSSMYIDHTGNLDLNLYHPVMNLNNAENNPRHSDNNLRHPDANQGLYAA